jgi:pimeloyl-ACP methyl ester carboxylesterase
MTRLRLVVVFSAFASGLAAQSLPPAPGALVDVGGGRRLHLLCSGQGSPTIVIEVGASSFAIDFTLVQRELQKSGRVCSYDRAGHGWSDPLPPFALANDVADLHTLLTAAGEKPPYVLAGASRGGLLIRGYLAAHPTDVAGLVFIDPASEDRLFGVLRGQSMLIAEMTAEQMRATVPGYGVRIPRRPVQTGSPFDKLPPELYQQRLLLDERFVGAMPENLATEQLALYQEHERAFLASLLATRKEGTPLGDRPTVVLSRGDFRNRDREESHAALAQLSTNSRHSIVARAGHEIHLFDPPAVVLAVKDVLAAIAGKARLAPAR